MVAIDTPAAAIYDPISCSVGSTSIRTGGFEMTFGLFNFHMDDDGATELISIIDPATPAADLVVPSTKVTQLAVENTPSSTSLPTSAKADPMLESSTLLVGSNNFQDPPPSPTIAYCIDCDAYHFVGDGDFSLHEITGCEDPRRGTAVVYPMISECKRALNALMLQLAPYDPDYVEGCTRTTYVRMMTSTLRPMKRSAIQSAHTRANPPYLAVDTLSIMTPI
jgi:hypothetical protein